jgi:hypothetical protein
MTHHHTYRLESATGKHRLLAIIHASSPEGAVDAYARLLGFEDAFELSVQKGAGGCKVIEITVF